MNEEVGIGLVVGFHTSNTQGQRLDPHHQQQTQQTFHVQLLRLAYPDAINIEPSAQRVAGNGAEFSSTLLVGRKSIQRLSFDGWASDMDAIVAVAF